MRRREFITLLGGAAAAWPLAARAQPTERARLVGIVAGFAEAEFLPLLAAFRDKLKELGWTEGRNLSIEVRLGRGDYKRMTDDAGQLISLRPDVILAQGTPGLTAVRQHSVTVPVVFVLVADPVRMGLIESLARPGGNATGLTNFEFTIGGKWLELLREASPRVAHVTFVVNPANPNADRFSGFIESSARSAGLDVVTASVRNPAEIAVAVADAGRRSDAGLVVAPDSVTTIHRELIIGLAAHHRLPAIYPFRIFPMEGGLMSYGLDLVEIYRQAAIYVDRILRGAQPSDLPVQAPNKFELIVNARTAKALGLEIPPTLLARADEVIE
jgi:putative tryptophan/tyrosine transport system substrate-binding protein